MKIYIAARFRKRDYVKKLALEFKKCGHNVISKWMDYPSIQPYNEHKLLAQKYATRDIESIKESDVFILLSDRSGTGMYTEFGEAIFSHISFGKPEIYIVGKYTSGSLHFFLPFVKRIDKISDIFNALK